MEIKNTYPEARLRMLDFFNSDAGLVNKCANDLTLLLDIVLKHKISWDEIKANLQMIKERLACVEWVDKKKVIGMNQYTSRNFKTKTNQLIDYLRSILNPRALKILKSVS